MLSNMYTYACITVNTCMSVWMCGTCTIDMHIYTVHVRLYSVLYPTESLEYLLACGCHADDPAGPTGATALHYVAAAGHGECVQVLLQYGASANSVVVTEEVRGGGGRKGGVTERGREGGREVEVEGTTSTQWWRQRK